MTTIPKFALLSVSDKSGIIDIAKILTQHGYQLLSTGGTSKTLKDAGLNVTDISEHTGFPEMMDGRVKTLHPKVHGGLLGVRNDAEHQKAMLDHHIAPIDIVILNLYPFEQTVARGANFDDTIEQIDIGGPSMLRSSAKNHAFVTIITTPLDYDALTQELAINHGATSAAFRKTMAAKAFALSASYDSAISQWFGLQIGATFPERFSLSATRASALHYGENPHQKAAFYLHSGSATGIGHADQLQGTALSYNNVNDADAALGCVREFQTPACVIVKHANPCGVATGSNITEAYKRAFACDTVSAYGGIIAVNQPVDKTFAEAISTLFLEVLIAPEITADARTMLEKKKKLKLLKLPSLASGNVPTITVKSVAGGLLVQEDDHIILDEETLKTVSETKPSDTQITDMKLAFLVAKHVKSNAIVLVKNGATIGIGAGQMSRIDSTNIAVSKARAMGLDTSGAVLASDAFFPFADNVELAAQHGIAAIIQPGGSIRDEEVVAAANKHNIAMVYTGVRHFRH
jgi:phosphoribosylaminoimidazolecarboxamide formyltransferase/IMP cyclohydrolase